MNEVRNIINEGRIKHENILGILITRPRIYNDYVQKT